MKNAAGFLLVLVLLLWSSCRSDFETVETTGNLEFSRDTVFLDTVFSNLSTSTYSLKVYNRSREDIFIPEISLQNGENSLYRLNVDGVAGNDLRNVEILARDSIYIFIETTVPSHALDENEFLYIDKLQFKSVANVQEVPLVTLVKDAVFLFPPKDSQGIPVGTNEGGDPRFITGFYLSTDQLTFSNQKPYVIYGYAAVPPGETLNIEPGARIHFHADSGILALENSTIVAKGTLSEDPLKMENEVVFQGDRLQNLYKNVPGQWGTIWLQGNSRSHIFENVTIRNATIGILAEDHSTKGTDITLKNVKIFNPSTSGIRAENTEISAENLVINNSGQSSLYLYGGRHVFKHVTIANYWQQSFRMAPAVLITNRREEPVPLQVSFYNSIIFGNENNELELDIDETVKPDLLFSHMLLKFMTTNGTDPFYDFSNSEIYQNIWLNEDPKFVSPQENDLGLLENSAAIDKGDPEVAQQVPLDLTGTDRIPAPDLGAYEYLKTKE